MTEPSYGILFHPAFPPETLGAAARRAEAVGFDELWLWDDCFLPGALTSAAIALAATRTLRVGIGLMPATAYNPLFAAMEITTLARAFPGRIFPGFGHGVPAWLTQIGAAPKSSLKTLGETVNVVRRLLAGECVSVDANDVHLDAVQMQVTPTELPPSRRFILRKGDPVSSAAEPLFIVTSHTSHVQEIAKSIHVVGDMYSFYARVRFNGTLYATL